MYNVRSARYPPKLHFSYLKGLKFQPITKSTQYFDAYVTGIIPCTLYKKWFKFSKSDFWREEGSHSEMNFA